MVVWVSEEIAPQMNERAGDWMKVTNNPDGSVIVLFEADNLNWVTGWVLSWGPTLRALEPPELVENVMYSVETIKSIYSSKQ